MYDRMTERSQQKSLIYAQLARYSYSRELELEADLFVYRFMEFMGAPEKYIEVLDILYNPLDDALADADATSDHPSIQYRKAILEFIDRFPRVFNNVKLNPQKN